MDVTETLQLGGRTLAIVHPPDPTALIDEDAFEHEEFLPYWAELWPSAVALARCLVALQLDGRRVVELGCGLAVPSIAASLGGAIVLATDWSPDALAYAERNARANGAELETLRVAWADPDELVARAPFDLVAAADVLYERRNVEQLLALLPPLGSEVLLADPGRPALAAFLEGAAASWEIAEETAEELPRGGVYRLVRRVG
ncbi:MAG: 50S ribosomal protein L11 methyltransferase [Actinobacteria bacterium]|nr:50S ribosomal protein L11 methyltransferase [Actinomycetota bacterium]